MPHKIWFIRPAYAPRLDTPVIGINIYVYNYYFKKFIKFFSKKHFLLNTGKLRIKTKGLENLICLNVQRPFFEYHINI